MSKRKKITVGIIGAGIGGLTAGVLLIKKGYDVKIFEKEQFLGGRALSFDNLQSLGIKRYKEILSSFNMKIAFSEPNLKSIFDEKMLLGYNLDLGYHAIGGGVLSNVNGVLSEINDHVDILESYVGLIKEDGYDFPFLSRIDKIKILPNILRLLFASEKILRNLDRISITETINKYGKGKMKLILEIFSRSITTVNNLDKISTGEMFRSQRNLYKGSKPCGYPKNGLSTIHKKLANYITINGGEIHIGKKIDKIKIQENKAVGFISGNDEYNYDIVVSNVLVQDLFSIVDTKYFEDEYVNYIKSLKGTGSLCAYYSLNKLESFLIGKTFHFIEREVGIDGNDAVGMVDFMASSSDSGLAPRSKYLVQSYIICTPEEAKNRKTLEKLRELLDLNLQRLVPDYKENLNWVIYPTVWHLDGVSKTIDNDKPDIKTNVKNLYIIGDSVKAEGIGFNCALNSSRKLVDILEKEEISG